MLTIQELPTTGKGYVTRRQMENVLSCSYQEMAPLGCRWVSSSTEFCAIHSLMLAKCDSVLYFGTGRHNAACHSPHGHMLIVAEFGNPQRQKKCEMLQTTDLFLSLCPLHCKCVFNSHMSSRLFVNIGYKIWLPLAQI